jgi:hypothetical protein
MVDILRIVAPEECKSGAFLAQWHLITKYLLGAIARRD